MVNPRERAFDAVRGVGTGLMFGVLLACLSLGAATVVLRRALALPFDPWDGAALGLAAGTVAACGAAGALVGILVRRPVLRLHALLALFLGVVVAFGESGLRAAPAATVVLAWLATWATLAAARRRPRVVAGLAGVGGVGAVALFAAHGGREAVPAGAADGRPPDILWVVLDTVRADHLPTAGYARDTAPRLAALAADAVVYERAYAPATWTLPSHASMLTGRLPERHGCTDATLFLDRGVPTAAELLAARGYRTALFSSNPWVGTGTGLDRGFAQVVPAWSDATIGRWFPAMFPFARWGAHDKGAALSDRAFAAWLDATPGDAPVFAFVNLVEAHVPYHELAGVDRATLLTGDALDAATAASDRYAALVLRNFGDPLPAAAERAALVGMYDTGIRAADRHLGVMLDALAARGRLDDTLVIVTADHGESFGEAGRWEHHGYPGEEVLHVPLVVRAPTGQGAPVAGRTAPAAERGARVAEPVSLVDLLPTVLTAAGAPIPAGLDGRALGAPADPDRALFADVYPAGADGLRRRRLEAWGWDPARFRFRVVQRGDRRLVRGPDGDHLSALADPDRDLAAAEPDTVATLAALLGAEPAAAPAAAAPAIDAETKARLEALGYTH